MKRLVSIETAAERYDVSPSTIRRMVKNGTLPYLRVGRQIRLDLSKIDAIFGEESANMGPWEEEVDEQ